MLTNEPYCKVLPIIYSQLSKKKWIWIWSGSKLFIKVIH